MALSNAEKYVNKKLHENFEFFAEYILKIRSKDGDITPFKLNRAQKYINDSINDQIRRTGKVRKIILKGRQQGCSTYTEGRFYWKTINNYGVRAFILTHEEEATRNLYEMVQRYYENTIEPMRPTRSVSNAKELIFAKLDSGYRIGTARNKGVGRSSTIQYFHGSEVAFWQYAEEHAKGILQAIPDTKNTEVILESTANGVGNYFYNVWDMAERGISSFECIFIPWYWQEEYRMQVPKEGLKLTEEEQELIKLYNLDYEQVVWRRNKIVDLSSGGINGEKAFNQEYPFTANEAFLASKEDEVFIESDLVRGARRAESVQEVGALFVGVDPARFGDDRTAIIRRKGRVAYKLQYYVKKDTMEVTGLVHKIIKDEKPEKVFVDVGGLGAGIVDRLRELGYYDIVIPVNGGEKPLEPDKYLNKRAEMWGEMKEWLRDAPVKIPDDNTLHTDLCSLLYKFDSKTRLLLESKADMKKRGLSSPDGGDALGLTFAYPRASSSQLRDKKIELSTRWIV